MRQRVEAELVANVISVDVTPGDVVAVGDMVVLLESMKMEIPVETEWAGTVAEVGVTVGDVVNEGDLIVVVETA
jgi:biotin carboxyl carrier protein